MCTHYGHEILFRSYFSFFSAALRQLSLDNFILHHFISTSDRSVKFNLISQLWCEIEYEIECDILFWIFCSTDWFQLCRWYSSADRSCSNLDGITLIWFDVDWMWLVLLRSVWVLALPFLGFLLMIHFLNPKVNFYLDENKIMNFIVIKGLS